jgi:hypothetical protein
MQKPFNRGRVGDDAEADATWPQQVLVAQIDGAEGCDLVRASSRLA